MVKGDLLYGEGSKPDCGSEHMAWYIQMLTYNVADLKFML